MGSIANITNEVVLEGRRNNRAWFAPAIAVIPSQSACELPEVRVHASMLMGNDIGECLHFGTADLGKTWSLPSLSRGLYRNCHPDDVFESGSVGLFYHRATRSLAGFGLTLFERDLDDQRDVKMACIAYERLMDRRMCYASWPIDENDFRPWRALKLPDNLARLGVCFMSGASQPLELADGTIIEPYCSFSDPKHNKVGTFAIEYDGEDMTILETGNLIGFDQPGGMGEPSLIEFDGRILMTLRSQYGDNRMYRAVSTDGLTWENFGRWSWDDGTEIESVFTQQHLLRHGDTLYLVYTRVNDKSNGVFRHRAPLFIAQVDTEKLCLIRETEQVVFPENGARMGNFSVANVTDDEAWILTGEWLEQRIEGYQKSDHFHCEIESAGEIYNRIQYIGDLLLARVNFK